MRIVECFEIRINNFSRCLFPVFTLLSAFAFIITVNQQDNNKWIALGGILLFGGGWIMVFDHKIIVQQRGFEIRKFRRTKFIDWNDVSELNFDMSYSIYSVHAELKIIAANKQGTVLQVQQYQAKPMRRFFEILNEQCIDAYKNEHFTNQALGKMNWRNKLKMF